MYIHTFIVYSYYNVYSSNINLCIVGKKIGRGTQPIHSKHRKQRRLPEKNSDFQNFEYTQIYIHILKQVYPNVYTHKFLVCPNVHTCSWFLKTFQYNWLFIYDIAMEIIVVGEPQVIEEELVKVRYELLPWLIFEVHEDWSVYSTAKSWTHVNGWVHTREWRLLKFTCNGNWYKISNISARLVEWIETIMWGKYKRARTIPITQHRLVYCAFNWLWYRDDFTVWHFDDDWGNNKLSNLYWIYGNRQNKQNLEHKQLAYRLLELYYKWEIQISAEAKKLLKFD